MTDDLVAQLRAGLDEDERVANSATSGPWTNDDAMARDGVFAPEVGEFVADGQYERMGPFAVHNAAHIARHDPARVLRWVKAAREILERHFPDQHVPECDWCEREWPCADIRALASVYVDEEVH